MEGIVLTFKLSDVAKGIAHKIIDEVTTGKNSRGNQSIRRAAHLAVNGKFNAAVREISPVTSHRNNIFDASQSYVAKKAPILAPYSDLVAVELKKTAGALQGKLGNITGLSGALASGAKTYKGFTSDW